MSRLRLNRHEVAGGLGDAGLFIPIAVALVAVNGLNATAVFAGGGLVYLATAAYFRVPIPVQPLKAFAAAAIALELQADVIAAGALLMSASMAVLGLTGAAGWLADRFPLVLVRGIQASVALLLAKAAVELAERGNWAGAPGVAAEVGLAVMVAGCAAMWLLRDGHVPGSLLVLAAGTAAGIAVAGGVPSVGLGPDAVGLSVPDGAAFATALTTLVLAQLPLTFGNSVVATADAERAYFGERARRVRPNRLAGSIAGANLLAGLTHGLPLCHGAGGVTAHVKSGARTAMATGCAGVLYLSLALLFGASLPAVLQLLLPGALGGMLLFVALQHALLAASLERLDDRLIACLVGVVTLLSGNLGAGFAAGIGALGLRRIFRRVGSRFPEPATS